MNNTTTNRYSSSITKGSLFLEETILVLDHVDLIDIQADNAVDFSFLPQNSERGRIKVGKEIIDRMQNTPWDALWLNFLDFADSDKKLIILYAVANHHEILQDCLIEVYHKRWLSMNNTLSRGDVSFWMDEKANVRPELLEFTENTRNKMAQVLFRTLYESGLIINESIVSVDMSPDLIQMMLERGEKWFLDVTHQNI
ncbi:MAG: hypothetical protein ACJATI_001024 [Halioglobus sp.]|jgi:hypothetical protein